MATSEIKAIKTLDTILANLDQAARLRVLKWAWEKYISEPLPFKKHITQATQSGKRPRKQAIKKSKTQIKSRPSIIKDLNLMPKGKKSFADFIAEKQPSSNQQKCTVAVYYLNQILDVASIGVDHVFTCYKSAGWRIPNLGNVLRLTAFRRGWLDTSNMMDVKLTTHGLNLIEHDLPPGSKGSKK